MALFGDNTALISGDLALSGNENSLILKGTGNTLKPALARFDPAQDKFIFDRTAEFPSGSVDVGLNLKLTYNAASLSGFALAFRKTSFYATTALAQTVSELNGHSFGDGIFRPFKTQVQPIRWQQNFPFDFVQNTTNSITFDYATATNLFFNKVKLRFGAAVNNVRIVIERQVSAGVFGKVWESHTDAQFAEGVGYAISDGENTIVLNSENSESDDTPSPLVNFGRTFEPFRATVETTESVLPILGLSFDIGFGVQFYPFLLSYAQDWRDYDIPDMADVQANNFGDTAEKVSLKASERPVWRQEGSTESTATAQQLVFDTNEADDDNGFTFTHQDADATLKSITIKCNAEKNDIQYILSSPTDEKFKEIFRQQSQVVGDNTIDFSNEPVLRNGQQYRVDIFGFNGVFGEDPMEVLGNGDTVPYYTMQIVEYKDEKVALEAPIGYMNMIGNTTDTVISSTGVDVKISGNLIGASENRDFSVSSNKLIYNGDRSFVAPIICDLTAKKATGGAGTRVDFTFVIYKNGVSLDSSVTSSFLRNSESQAISLLDLTTFSNGDELEVYVRNDENTDDVLVTDLQILVR